LATLSNSIRRDPNGIIVSPFIAHAITLPSITPPNIARTQQKYVEELMTRDPLATFTSEELDCIWNCRYLLMKEFRNLPFFLQSVKWHKIECRFEAYRCMFDWSPPLSPLDAIDLFQLHYNENVVREYAVQILRRLTCEQLQPFLLQLVQSLRFESFHRSSLSEFLMERALESPLLIGQPLYWHMKVECQNPQMCERLVCFMEELLTYSPLLSAELRKQNAVVKKLSRVSELVRSLKKEGFSDFDCMKEYKNALEKLNRQFFGPMKSFRSPLNPKQICTTLIIEKCRYMSSKMVPLFIVFANAEADADPISMLFKTGDDLRQDMLTLQLVGVMDEIWLNSGLDLKMKPYRCLSTGENERGEGVGLIEVVLNSETTSSIQLKYGGGAMGKIPICNLCRCV
jgi:phosphatidylinositol-4,5-bisphosphate 3-kinase